MEYKPQKSRLLIVFKFNNFYLLNIKDKEVLR